MKLMLLLVIIIVGYTRGSWANVNSAQYPFIDADFGADGIFLGAAIIFFTYTGFDAIGNAAEEVRVLRRMCDVSFACVLSHTFIHAPRPALAPGDAQARNVAHLPWAIVGTVAISMVTYFMLAVALVLMVSPSISHPNPILYSPSITFIAAFVGDGARKMSVLSDPVIA